MTTEFLLGFGLEAVKVTLLMAAPILICGLVVGLLVGIFQAATQIHEMTLTFIPKIIAVMIALVVFFPWMLELIVNFTRNIFTSIPNYIR